MKTRNRRSLWLVVSSLICLLLIGALIVSAQATPPSILIGENQTSSLTDASSTSLFSVTVTTPQNINVLILATSPSFAPAFRVIDPNNAVIFDAANAQAQTLIQSPVTLASLGTYLIEVRSANNSAGQFTLSIQPGAPFNPPIPLPLQQLVTATVDPQNPQKIFSFTALSTDALFVEATSTLPTSGPIIRLVNADASDPTGNTFGLANAHLTLARFRMPMGTTHYLLDVTHSGSTFPETVTICLWPEHGASCAGSGGTGVVPLNPTAVATQNTNGTCSCEFTATGIRGGNVDIYTLPGPSTMIGQIPPNTTAQVIGELPDHSWIEVNYNGVIGWVWSGSVFISNTCLGIPVITPTPPPGRRTPTPHLTLPTRTLPPPQLLPTATLPPLLPTATLHLQPLPTVAPTLNLHPVSTPMIELPTPTPIIIK
ncbi:MAG: SH3 domain-containing protein [Chloroflexota bacterium]